MDIKVTEKLENLMEDFNNELKENNLNGKDKKELLERFDDLTNQYKNNIINALEELKFSYNSILEYAETQIDILSNSFKNNLEDHGLEFTDTLISMNKKELEKNLNVLSAQNISKDEQTEEIHRNSNSKINQAEYQLDDQKHEDNRSTEKIEAEFTLLTNDIASHANKIMSSNLGSKDYVEMARIESNIERLRNYCNKTLTPSLAEKYNEALTKHSRSILENFEEKNAEYSQQVERISNGEIEIENKENPWELPKEFKDKVEEVGKQPVKESEPDKEQPSKISLPGDLIL
jgi:hypothetical protein